METIALIEQLDPEGQVLQMHRVHRWPQRIGRAVDNDFVIDDPHVAAHHATLAPLPDTSNTGAVVVGIPPATQTMIELTVGQSINGVTLNPSRKKGSIKTHAQTGQSLLLASGTVFQVGGVLLRLRLPSELLVPERPLPPETAHRLWLMPTLALLWLSILFFDQWTRSHGGTELSEMLIPVLAASSVLIIWSAIWALLSKLFQGRFSWGAHLRIALSWMLGLSVLVPLLNQASFALDWSVLGRLGPTLEAAGGCAMVWMHLNVLLPRRRLRAGLALLAVFVSLTFFKGYEQYSTQKRWFGELYATTISLPGVRLVEPKPIEEFIQSVQSLEAVLTEQVRTQDNEAEAPAARSE